jgi:predicted nucleic acid-binding protein
LVVSNTSPLVYLAALGDFELLRDLFSKIVIPRAVFREIAAGGADLPIARSVQGAMASWLSVKDVATAAETERFLKAGLHPGESEAIVLAVELGSEALLMDDGDGIKAAAAVGANVIRTPGIYRLAKQRGFVKAVRPKLDDLRKAGFWLRDEHYRMVLESLGE